MVGGAGVTGGRDDVEGREVVEEELGVLAREVLQAHTVTGHPGDNLIVHVRQIAHVVHLEAETEQNRTGQDTRSVEEAREEGQGRGKTRRDAVLSSGGAAEMRNRATLQEGFVLCSPKDD